MNTEEKQILINKYFSKTLSEAERKDFEQLKATDESFQQHFASEELLYESLLYDSLKEQFKSYNQTSENPFVEATKTTNQRPRWFRRLGVAASILLVAVFGVLAAERAGLIAFKGLPFFGGEDEVKEDKTIPLDSMPQKNWKDTIPGTLNDEVLDAISFLNPDVMVNNGLTINLRAASQQMKISTNKTYVLSTGTGLNININKHIWEHISPEEAITDSIDLVFREVLSPEGLLANAKAAKVLKVFKLSFDQIPGLAFSELYPITISQPLSSDSSKPISLLYGGDGEAVSEWKLEEEDDRAFMKKPTKIMDDYQMYMASVELIDSIKNNYVLKESEYVRKSDESVRIKESFIKERIDYLIAYQENPEFYSLVQLAKNQWAIYQAQRQITVNTTTEGKGKDQLNIIKPGWYAIVQ